ncbi:ANTAR domain-containing response regulator [Aquisalimonas asiatica]|nr:ANTAR domain-containing protein [Aquisalimonas asiatica]
MRRNFRGDHALIACAEGQDRAVLVQQLSRLGVTSSYFDGRWERVADTPLNLVFFDAEAGRQLNGIEEVIDAVEGPSIALIGSDTPSSVSWVIQRCVCGYLTKPLRRAGILASMIIAYHAYDQRRAREKRVARLEQQVRARQVVCSAAIHLTEQFHVTVNDAFRLMQDISMRRRLSMEDLAAMIVSGEIATSALVADIQLASRPPGSTQDRQGNA